jgi:hypothetical protein
VRPVTSPVAACYELLTHTTACGHSCETIVNCLDTNQLCVNGECVDNELIRLRPALSHVLATIALGC